MTIAAELDRIISAKSDILSAINDKGVSTAGTTSISQCPALINAIQTGGGGGGNTLINSGFTGSAVVSGTSKFEFVQKPINSYGNSSLSAESGFISSRTTTRTAYKMAAVVYDSAIRYIDGFSASGMPNYTAGSAAIILAVRSSNTGNVYSASIYNQAINSTNSALVSASAELSVRTSINSALSASNTRKLYVFTAISASGSNSAALNTGYTASTADISADARLITSTSYPYPDDPVTAYGNLSATATAYEIVDGMISASAQTNNIYNYYASSYAGSGQLVYGFSANDTLMTGSASYTGAPLGFSVFNAQTQVSSMLKSTASARSVYSSLYPTADYTYSSLILPPPMTSIVSQNII